MTPQPKRRSKRRKPKAVKVKKGWMMVDTTHGKCWPLLHTFRRTKLEVLELKPQRWNAVVRATVIVPLPSPKRKS